MNSPTTIPLARHGQQQSRYTAPLPTEVQAVIDDYGEYADRVETVTAGFWAGYMPCQHPRAASRGCGGDRIFTRMFDGCLSVGWALAAHDEWETYGPAGVMNNFGAYHDADSLVFDDPVMAALMLETLLLSDDHRRRVIGQQHRRGILRAALQEGWFHKALPGFDHERRRP